MAALARTRSGPVGAVREEKEALAVSEFENGEVLGHSDDGVASGFLAAERARLGNSPACRGLKEVQMLFKDGNKKKVNLNLHQGASASSSAPLHPGLGATLPPEACGRPSWGRHLWRRTLERETSRFQEEASAWATWV